MPAFQFTPSDLQTFTQTGFLYRPAFFSTQEIATLLQTIEALAQIPPADCIGQQMVYFEDSVFPEAGKVLARIEKFVEYNAHLKQTAEDPRLLDTLRQLLGDEPILFKEKINFKMPGGRGFEPHQDIQPGWDTYANYFISALITIDPSTVENGCLELAAGHHRCGLLGEKWKPLTPEQLRGVEFVKFPTAPGDVIFFDCFAPHQSAPNQTDLPRRNLYLTYNRKVGGDHRLRYYADKRQAFPPDFEREAGKEYRFKV